MERLYSTLGEERLDGDNKYNCPQCRTKTPATRLTSLHKLPPILHFTLVRFAYDLKAGQKKKSKAIIKFPQKLEIGDHEYYLQAVVSHFGTDNHGHFVCEALELNEESGCWWLCNDEEVTKIDRAARSHSKDKDDESGPPAKKAKTDWSELSSRDAYMLVYSRKDPLTSSSTEPPTEVLRKVSEDTCKWVEEIGDRERKKYILEDEYTAITAAKKQVAAVLSGQDRLLPSVDLERFFNASTVAEMFGPWKFPVCAHGAIDPEATGEFKLVSQAAFDLLRDYCTPQSPHLNDKDAANSISPSSSSLNGKDRSKPTTPPSSATSVLYSSLPELAICSVCVGEQYSERAVPEIVLSAAERAIWQAEVKRDKGLVNRELDKRPHVYGVDYYYLPDTFVDAWRDYVQTLMMAKPKLAPDLERCKHGLLDVDLQMDDTHYITSYGWENLMEL